jgi:catechol 2,3-dioxygenase-like lactoylglutathione lyase family enzyme
MRNIVRIGTLASLLAVCLTVTVFGEPPSFYQRVDRLVWVVNDLEEVVQGWERLGFPAIRSHGELELQQTEFRGRRVSPIVKAATGQLRDVKIHWIQPLTEDCAYGEFLDENGPGVFSLVHHTSSLEEFEAELLRLQGLGVEVLQSEASALELGWERLRFFDTLRDGKYVLGLLHDPDPKQTSLPDSAVSEPFEGGIIQYAFAVRDPNPVSQYWQRLGFPAFEVVPVVGREKRYRGQPAEFDMNLGWQRHGTVPFEWCIPLGGPTVYADHIEVHGEGFHHIGLRTKDLDELVEKWNGLGVEVIQSGAWGEKGKPGSGRYAYMDTDSIGGIAVELLWSFRE